MSENNRLMQGLRIIYLLAGAGALFMFFYFLDKPLSWTTLGQGLTQARLYIGVLLALSAVLALEALIFRVTQMTSVPVFILIVRWGAFLLMLVVYTVVNR